MGTTRTPVKKKHKPVNIEVSDNVVANRQVLTRALATANKAVPGNPVIPLLGNVLVEFNNKNSRIAATNLEIGISVTFETTGRPFATCLPAKVFQGLIETMSGDEVDLQMDIANQSVLVMTEKSSSSIKSISPEDFPDIPVVDEIDLSLPVIMFKNMVNRVALACKPEGESSELEGAKLIHEAGNSDQDLGKFIMYAADGIRLSYEETDMISQVGKGISALVRGVTLELICKMLPDDGELEIQQKENKILFHCGAIDIVSQILSGNLPDYKRFEATVKDRSTTLTISTLEFLRACKQLKVFVADTGMSKLVVQDMLVRYSTTRQERGDTDVMMFGDKEGDDIEIGLNVFYILEILEVISTDNVVLKFNGAKKPVLMSMENIDNFYYIIMPFNLG